MTNRKNKKGYSLLEVQVSLIILMVGFLGLVAMISTNSRQLEKAEAWCAQDSTYFIISCPNIWMLRTGGPAIITDDPNITAWQPAVSEEKNYEIRLDSFTKNPDAKTASAEVKLSKIK